MRRYRCLIPTQMSMMKDFFLGFITCLCRYAGYSGACQRIVWNHLRALPASSLCSSFMAVPIAAGFGFLREAPSVNIAALSSFTGFSWAQARKRMRPQLLHRTRLPLLAPCTSLTGSDMRQPRHNPCSTLATAVPFCFFSSL